MAKAHKSDLLLLVMNQFIWGVGWSAIKYPQDQMGPFTLNAWTMLISVVVLYPFAHRELATRPLKQWGNARPLTGRDYLDYFIMGFVGLAGMTLLYNWGTGKSLAANGALISMAVPVLTAVIAVFVLAEKMTIGRIGSLLIAIVGVLIISDVRGANLSLAGGYLLGNSLLLAGALCNAIYVVYSKRLLEIASPTILLFWGQVLGFIGSVPFVAMESFHLHSIVDYRWQTWASLIFLGTIYFAVAMMIFFKILSRLDAGQIMVSNYLQPVFGVLMAAILLHEKVTRTMAIGGMLVVAGTALATFEESWQAKKLAATASAPGVEPQ
jgi:drug/metabolite transporter (DMT)-like permease